MVSKLTDSELTHEVCTVCYKKMFIRTENMIGIWNLDIVICMLEGSDKSEDLAQFPPLESISKKKGPRHDTQV
jgi:hypothetical protein